MLHSGDSMYRQMVGWRIWRLSRRFLPASVTNIGHALPLCAGSSCACKPFRTTVACDRCFLQLFCCSQPYIPVGCNFNVSGSGRRHYRPAFLFASLWNCPLAPFPSEILAPLSLLRSIPPFRPKAFSPSVFFSLFLPKMFSPLSLLRSFPPFPS